MKTLLSLALVIVLFTCCNNKPNLSLSDQSPYTLNITDFAWSYGLTEINKFNGDFEKLDQKVFDLLKGKNGTCKVYIEDTNKDQYGRITKLNKYVGVIELAELNKYETWEYWHKNAGIKTLIYKFINKHTTAIQVDSVAMEPSSLDNTIEPIPVPAVDSIDHTQDLVSSEDELTQVSEHGVFAEKVPLMIQTTDIEIGAFEATGYVIKETKSLALTFTLTKHYISVNDEAHSIYRIDELISKSEKPGLMTAMFKTRDEKNRACQVRLFFGDDTNRIWVYYSDDEIFRYTQYLHN